MSKYWCKEMLEKHLHILVKTQIKDGNAEEIKSTRKSKYMSFNNSNNNNNNNK